MEIAVFVLGAILGSFVSAFTHRLVRNENFVEGRSKCPKCKAIIQWFDNIPLLSFLWLQGRCRNCHKKISIRYPLIEASMGFLFLIIYLNKFETVEAYNLINLLFYFVITVLMVSIFVIDWEFMIIPDSLVYALLLILTIYLVGFGADRFFERIFAGFLSSLVLLTLHFVTLGKGMGLGDVKFAIFGGMFFGYPGSLYWFFISFMVGGAVGTLLLLLGKAKLGRPIPFGPFLITAFFIQLLWGDLIKTFLYF